MAALLATMTGCGANAPPSTPSLYTPASVTPTETSPLATPECVADDIDGRPTFFSVPTSSLSAISVFDWNGQLVGQGTASVPLECCTVEQSPDGSRLEVATATGSVVLGRFGRPVQSPPPSPGGPGPRTMFTSVWRRKTAPSSTEGELYLVGPGDQSKKVATISGFGPHTATGVVACDVGENLALLATSFMGSPESLTEIRRATARSVAAEGRRIERGLLRAPGHLSRSYLRGLRR